VRVEMFFANLASLREMVSREGAKTAKKKENLLGHKKTRGEKTRCLDEWEEFLEGSSKASERRLAVSLSPRSELSLNKWAISYLVLDLSPIRDTG